MRTGNKDGIFEVLSISVRTALVTGLLVLISFAQPLAMRLELPYTVSLAILGTALACLAAFLLYYTPLTDVFNDIVEPLVNFPINASVFLVVFLPLLLFHAALTIDVRELVDDIAPILTLAVLAVLVSAAGVGLILASAGGVQLTVALLLGSIVATTDPAAVVAIFRELGVPLRLVRLVEGESLLNDAAAIVLFTALLKIIGEHIQPSLTEGAFHFVVSFGGGLVLGFVGGRLFGVLVPLLGAAKPADRRIDAGYKLAIMWGGLRGAVTLALALAVTENPRIDASTQSQVAVLATGFVLFTLLVNGLTLRPFMRLLGLDRLSPLNKLLRNKVLALISAEFYDAITETSREFELTPSIAKTVIANLTQRRETELGEDQRLISDHNRITVGLVALTNRERRSGTPFPQADWP